MKKTEEYNIKPLKTSSCSNHQSAKLIGSKVDDVLNKIHVVHTIALSLMNQVETMMITETEANFNKLKTCMLPPLQADYDDHAASVTNSNNQFAEIICSKADDVLTQIHVVHTIALLLMDRVQTMMNTEEAKFNKLKTCMLPLLQADDDDHGASISDSHNHQSAELMGSKSDDVLTKIHFVHTIALSLMNQVETMMITEAEFKTSSCSPVKLQSDDASITESYNNQSAELIGSNDDFLTEIRIRLPAKSFFHSKSVSKQWLSLLSTHPRFNTLWFDKLLISSGLYYYELHVPFDVQNPTTPPFHGLDFSPDHIDGIRIVQSCNGLLLCCGDKDHGCCGNYYVCNPTTKKVAAIPPVIGDDDLIRLMGLAYHPTKCVHYKLVCILRAGCTPWGGFNKDGDRMYNIQIYSAQTGEWKKLNQTFAPICWTEFRYGVYWNGAFHWAPSCSNPMYLRLDNEEVRELPLPMRKSLPRYYSPFTIPLYFGESGGHLHLVDTADDYKKSPLGLNVYEMPRDHSGWSIKYQLDLHQLSVHYPNMTHKYGWHPDRYDFRVLDVVRGEKEEDTFMVVKAVDDIKRYNIRDKSFKQLLRVPDNTDVYSHGNGTTKFTKTVHRFVGHRYIKKLGSF